MKKPGTWFVLASILGIVIGLGSLSGTSFAEDDGGTARGGEGETPSESAAPVPTTVADLDAWIRRIEPEPERKGSRWQFELEGRHVVVIADPAAGRMRIVTPIAPAGKASRAELERALQANFDAVLDVRYAIAQGMIWSAFIHPLGSLTAEDFFGGVGQAIVAADTYGTLYSSGALVFGGGDSRKEHRELLERLRRLQPI